MMHPGQRYFQALPFYLAALLILEGCAVARVYDSAQIKSQFSQSLEKAADQVAAARRDHQDQTAIINQLSRKPSKTWPSFAPEAKKRLAALTESLSRLDRLQSQMADLSGQFSAYTYNLPTIRSNQAEWGRADQLVADYQARTASLNKELETYNRESSALITSLEKSGSFQRVSIVSIEERLRTSPNNWRAAYNRLVGDYNRDKASYEQVSPTIPEERREAQAPLTTHMKSMFERLQAMNKAIETCDALFESFSSAFAAKTSVTNLDPQWTQIETYKGKFQSAQESFQQELSEFVHSDESFKEILKDLRAP